MDILTENRTNDVLNKMQSLTVTEDKVETEFSKEFGSRLRLSKGALLIQKIGNQLHCSIITITKAMVLFHKVKRNPNFNSSCLSSVACLNLSIKICEEDVSPDEIVIKSYHTVLESESTPNIARPNPSADELAEMKKQLNSAEYAICVSMSFEIECSIAHMYVYRFLVQLQSVSDASEGVIVSISSAVTKLMSTYYLCEGCIDFTAEEIAWACLQFAYLYCGIVSPSIKYHLRKELTSVVDKEHVCQIVDEFILVADVSTTLKYI